MNKAFLDYYRCPEQYADFRPVAAFSSDDGYFRLGPDAICFGQSAAGRSANVSSGALYDALQDVRIERCTCFLPFDPTSIVDNLRWERYARAASINNGNLKGLVRNAYYLLRPALPVSVRKFLQRASVRGWDRVAFPEWPVDRTVDRILRRLLAFSMKAKGVDRLPFIWFWPDGYSSCAMMTHDVETRSGLRFCPSLMDIDDSFGIKSSFQLIPETRYVVTESTLSRIRDRGFEVNIHDLNHDGHLYRERNEFLCRVERINRYGREYGATGFRSGALNRNLDWYDAFAFSYDMSVPNVGHLDAQPGGCCTVMPYFIGRVLELPLTTIQDYSLFHLLSDYSIELWKRQIGLILKEHGLMSFNVHPDYVRPAKAKNIYRDLLTHLSQLRLDEKIWMALPGEVDRWWRQRSEMKLVDQCGGWAVEGPGKERAKVAYATLNGDDVVYALPQAPRQASPV